MFQINMDLPIYQETDKDLGPGLYLALFHGRDDPAQDMDEWGFNGPVIGPLRYLHTTYVSNLKLDFASWGAMRRYFEDGDPVLWLKEDMIEYQGKYYGDWTVFHLPIPERK